MSRLNLSKTQNENHFDRFNGCVIPDLLAFGGFAQDFFNQCWTVVFGGCTD